MPELPEIENVCAILRLYLVNEKILDVQINQHKLRADIPDNLNAIATGQTITAIHRIAKYIVIELANNHSIISHLGMTGAWLFREQGEKHDHLFMHLTNNIKLTYNDPRKFGLIAVSPSPAINHNKLLAQIGMDPLSAQFSPEFLYQLLQQSSSNIKAFLMNQAIIAGIGNIYASEILFMTKIHPLRKACDISVAEAAAMHQVIQNILCAAIQHGGSYIKNYIMPTANRGGFQHQLQVYDRTNKNCFCCSQPVQRMTQNNRSTFYCNNCQR